MDQRALLDQTAQQVPQVQLERLVSQDLLVQLALQEQTDQMVRLDQMDQRVLLVPMAQRVSRVQLERLVSQDLLVQLALLEQMDQMVQLDQTDQRVLLELTARLDQLAPMVLQVLLVQPEQQAL